MTDTKESVHNARTLVGYAFLCAALAATVWAIIDLRSEFNRAIVQFELPLVVVSVFLGVGAMLAMFCSWISILRDSSAQLGSRDGLRIYAVAQLGKYLPGAVWPLLAQATLGRMLGISSTTMVAGGLISLTIGVACAIGIGCALLPAVSGASVALNTLALVFAATALAILVWPPILNRLISLFAKLFGRKTVTVSYTVRGVLAASAWCCLANVLFGCHVMVLGLPFGMTGLDGYILGTCAYSLASAIGVLVVFAPAGAGAREAMMVLILSTALTVSDALAVALVSRAILILVDALLAVGQAHGLRRVTMEAKGRSRL